MKPKRRVTKKRATLRKRATPRRLVQRAVDRTVMRHRAVIEALEERLYNRFCKKLEQLVMPTDIQALIAVRFRSEFRRMLNSEVQRLDAVVGAGDPGLFGPARTGGRG